MVPSRSPFRGLVDVEAWERVPLAKRIGRLRSTLDLIQRSAERSPDRPAITFIPGGTADEDPVTITYGELISKIHQAANAFAELGVGPEDAVSFLLPNLPETHITLWGAEAAGIVSPINPLLEVEAITDIVQAAGAKVLVAVGAGMSEEIWAKAEAVRHRLPGLRAILQVGGPGDDASGIHDFDAVLSSQPGDRLVFDRRIEPGHTAAWFHTGGTTGSPKLAPHTHHGQIYCSWALTETGDMVESDVLLCGLPLFHANGVIVTGLAPFMVGATVVLPSPLGYRDAGVVSQFWRLVERYRVSFFSAVPTVYAALLQVPVGDRDLSSLRFALCGAAPMPVETFKAFEERTGVRILEGYGLTEGTVVSAVNPRDGERRIGSIGVRIPYQEMKAVRLGAGGQSLGDCDDDEIGTVVIRGPNVLSGYRREGDNRSAFLEGGWFVTGDLGRRDPDGYFWLTGRSKDLIIRGGHNIDPAVIDEALAGHPAVGLAAAVGRPDPRVGELPVAFVSLVEGSSATPAELLAYAAERITERAAVPKAIHVLPALPLTAVGKIFKPELRWRATRIALDEALAPLVEAGSAITVDVGPDQRHGTKARVRVSGVDAVAVADRARAILGTYPVAFDVIIE